MVILITLNLILIEGKMIKRNQNHVPVGKGLQNVGKKLMENLGTLMKQEA